MHRLSSGRSASGPFVLWLPVANSENNLDGTNGPIPLGLLGNDHTVVGWKTHAADF